MKQLSKVFLASQVAFASAKSTSYGITATSWGAPRIDVFGIAPNTSIYHKYYTGYDWQPAGPIFENMLGKATSAPTAFSWGSGRIDYVVLGTDYQAYHKFWDGSQWNPTGRWHEKLGGKFKKGSGLSAASWGVGRVDLVGIGEEGECLHKFFDGSDWKPEGEWENFGGNFSTPPAAVSWGPDRIDLAGITMDGELLHMYWDGEGWSKWEDMKGGPFVGSPSLTSWGKDRFDFWAAGEDGGLWHKYWDGTQYSDWEKLGDDFETAPTVVHWMPDRTDILGQRTVDDAYWYKYYGGGSWSDWYSKGGPFVSAPAVVTLGEGNLNFIGAGGDGELKLQVWAWDKWLPSSDEWYSLGNVASPFGQEELLQVQDL